MMNVFIQIVLKYFLVMKVVKRAEYFVHRLQKEMTMKGNCFQTDRTTQKQLKMQS